jgi:hypothetical protein
MPFSKGEVYHCPDTNCSCEVTVTKAPLPTCPDSEVLTCCGKVMIKN